MANLAVGGLQLELAAGDNLELIGQEIDLAMMRFPWLQMLVLPELCSFGPSTDHAVDDPAPVEAFFADLARRHGVWLIPGSLFYRHGDEIRNTAPVFGPDGKVVARYAKRYPFVPYERGVDGGDAFVVFDVPGAGRVGLMICYDMWFPEMARQLAWMGAEALIVPTLTNTIDRDLELSIARTNAALNQAWLVNINVAGRLGYGRSIVVNPDGTVVNQSGSGREVITVDLDFDYVRRARGRGMQGISQTLKAFRDAAVTYPVYQQGSGPGAFEGLGPMSLPEREGQESGQTGPKGAP